MMVGKPKILQLLTRMNVGGPARHVVHLATQLGSEFEVHVASGPAPSDEGSFVDPRVPVLPVSLGRAPSPSRDLRALTQVRSLIRAGDFDVVHTHMAKAGAIGRLAAMSVDPRPRLVHTFHGHVLDGYFSAPAAQAYLRIERWLARRTDVLVAVSDQTRDRLLDLGVGAPSQWRVIRPGSDLDPFLAAEPGRGCHRTRLGVPPDATLVAAIGRLAPVKDHRTLIEAIAQVNAHLVIGGDGPLRPELEEFVRRLGIAERVHFAGWQRDVPSLLSEVDVVALTSTSEGTPLALIEAQAAGLPVVATDVGGVRDIIVEGRTGFLVKCGDVGSIAAAIERLAADPELRTRLGAAGRTRVVENYSQWTSPGQMSELYRDLCTSDG